MSPALTQPASLSDWMNFPVTVTRSLVICPKLSLVTSSWPYFSVTVTASCLCVASSTAWYIFVSSSITWSLINRISPLQLAEDILRRGEKKSRDYFLSWEQAEGHQRLIVRSLVSAYPAHLSPRTPTPETPPMLTHLTQMQTKEPILQAGD